MLQQPENGSERYVVPINAWEDVLPMDIMPNPLYRAILVEDIEEMEQLGIIECDDEDFALCSFACPSKIDVGGTIRQGLDLMEKESEIFGNRTISGFLSQVGAEEGMASDQVVWSEQSRLHLSYTMTLGGTGTTLVATHDADGQAVATSGTMSTGHHGIRAGDMLM